MKWLLVLAFWIQSSIALCVGLNWTIQPDNNSVTFTTTGMPNFVKIKGEGGMASGIIVENEGKVYGTVEVLLTTLKTGMELRDKHMKEKYLDVEKFPKAIFVLDPVLPAGTGFPFTGKLTVKQDTIAVVGTAKISTLRPDSQEVTAEFEVEMKSLKSVGVPEYMGITVAEKIKVLLKFKVSSK